MWASVAPYLIVVASFFLQILAHPYVKVLWFMPLHNNLNYIWCNHYEPYIRPDTFELQLPWIMYRSDTSSLGRDRRWHRVTRCITGCIRLMGGSVNARMVSMFKRGFCFCGRVPFLSCRVAEQLQLAHTSGSCDCFQILEPFSLQMWILLQSRYRSRFHHGKIL